MLLLWVVLLSQLAEVQAAPTPAGELTTATLTPIDVLESSLPKKFKNKRARTLKQAYSAWKKGQRAQARALASSLARDGMWGDFGLWIQYGSLQEDAAAALAAKRYAEAAAHAQKAVQATLQIEARFPYSPFLKGIQKQIAQSELLWAEALQAQGSSAAAALQYELGFMRYANAGGYNSLTPDIITHYAAICAKRPAKAVAERETCESWLYRFTTWFPKGAPETRGIAKLLPSLGERPRAVSYGVRSSQGYKAPDLDQAAYESAIREYFDGHYGRAIKQFRQFLDDYPRSAHRFRVRYWLTQALTQENDHEKAQIQYQNLYRDSPLSYYGLLAALATGQQMDVAIGSTLPLASESDPALTPMEQLHLRRAQALLAEKAPALAEIELRELRTRDPLSSPFLMYLALLNHLATSHTMAFTVIGDLIARNYDGAFSSSIVRMVFPVEYMDLIKKHATDNGLDPILVLSLIKQESAFDSDAGSQVGAMGLMQLMPATAADTDPEVRTTELLNPDINIRVGTKYLRQLLTRFNGNIALALAAYNAGPNAVDRWQRENSNRKGMLEFIEVIPYKETREYVAGIIRNYYWYSRKLNGEIPSNINTFWTTYGPNAQPEPKSNGAPQAEPAPAAAPLSKPITRRQAHADAPKPSGRPAKRKYTPGLHHRIAPPAKKTDAKR